MRIFDDAIQEKEYNIDMNTYLLSHRLGKTLDHDFKTSKFGYFKI